MKRFITLITALFISATLLGQTATNYKEGDFSGKQVKAKSIKLYDNWLIEKNSSGTMTLKYNGTSVATLTAAGAFAPTSISAAGNITSSAGVVTAVGMYGDFFDWTTGDTLTNALGRVVFIAADSSLYVCRSIVSPHNYWKVTH